DEQRQRLESVDQAHHPFAEPAGVAEPGTERAPTSKAGNLLFFERGQHATSICGALGSAVAAGLLMGLDAEGLTHAIGVAASFASGVIDGNRTGGTVKRMHGGWAAHAGVTAADLTRRGITGPPTALEGRFGRGIRSGGGSWRVSGWRPTRS